MKVRLSRYKSFIYGYLLLLLCTSAFAQQAELVQLERHNGRSMLCDENSIIDAGTIISISALQAESNEVTKASDPIFLCYNDIIFIEHDHNALFDALMETEGGGVGYAYYYDEPLVPGFSLIDIQREPAPPIPNPSGVSPFWIARGQPNGDAYFRNEGQVQNQFFNGNPGLIWFAPITLSEFETPAIDEDCVRVSIEEAFSIVYLNEIYLADLQTGPGSTSGTLRITGGLPEWDALQNIQSSYTITMVNTQDPSIVGTINEVATHDGTVTFDVPQPGNYTITISDDMGCSISTVRNIPADEVPVVLCLPDSVIDAGSQICIPVTTTDFTGVATFFFSVLWDPGVIEFQNLTNFHPVLGQIFPNFDDGDSGVGSVLWADLNADLQSIPDSSVLFEICFDVIGSPGERTLLEFSPNPISGTSISITNDVGEIPFETKNGSVTVTPPSTVSVFDLTGCQMGADLEIQFTAYGGEGPYTFEIIDADANVIISSGSISSPGETIQIGPGGLNAIEYTIIVTDNSGTRGQSILDLSSVVELDFILTASDPSCADSEDGYVRVDGLVANGSTSFEWLNENTGERIFGTDSIGGLQSGRWRAIVTDDNGCTATEVLNIDATTAVLLPVEIRNPVSCSGVADGELYWNTSTANAYEYRWFDSDDNPVGNAVTSDNGSNRSNLLPGTYRVEVQDVAGTCPALRDTFTLVANKTLSIDLDASSDEQVSCAGMQDAEVQLTASADFNDSQDYTFTWSDLQGGLQNDNSNSTIVTGLGPGTYFVTAMDNVDGCFQRDTITIEDPPPLNVNATISQPSCPDGQNGEIDFGFFNNVGGTPYESQWPPYDLDWNGIQLNTRSSTGPSLVAGDYSVALTDANGCTDSVSFMLRSGPTIGFDDDLVDLTCIGDNDAELEVIGDVAGNDISWSNGESSPAISGLSAGVYTVTVTETIGDSTCAVRDSFEILDPVFPVSITRAMRFDALSGCSEDPNGRIFNLDINIGGPKDWQWTGPGVDTLIEANEPFLLVSEAGEYTYSVLDLNDCIVYDSSITVSFPEPILVDTNMLLDVSCFGAGDGQIELMVTRPSTGSDQFEFRWSTGETAMGPPNNTDGINGLDTGQYSVEIVDLLDPACVAEIQLTIDQPEPLSISLDSTTSRLDLCFGDQNGMIEMLWEGGNRDAAPTITWSHDSSLPGLLAENLGAAVYNVELVDSRGCSDMQQVEVTELSRLQALFDMPMEPNCNGGSTTLVVDDAMGGLPGYSFSVDNGPTQILGTEIPIFAGEHVISLFDAAGCRMDDTINILEPEEIQVDLGDEVVVALGGNVRLDPDLTGVDQIDSFIWNPSQFLSCPDCRNPLASPQDDQRFVLEVIDLNGCRASGEVMVRVDKARNLHIPNAFSPNNDGINDKWQIFTGPSVLQIRSTRVFDRWGNLVYEQGAEPPSGLGTQGWDGRVDSQMLQPGVYLYLVEVDFVDNNTFLYRGDINLVR